MNEHLTTLKRLRDELVQQDYVNESERDALDAAIKALELLEAADTFDIYFNGVGEIRKTEVRRTILARKFGDPDVKTEHESASEAFTALQEKTK